MESEFHHLGARIPYLNILVRDDCSIYFGRFDNNVPDVHRACVDVLLTSVICRNIVTVSSADGNIYVRRLCRCAALYNDFFANYQLSTIYTLSQTSQPLQITEGSKYLVRPSL